MSPGHIGAAFYWIGALIAAVGAGMIDGLGAIILVIGIAMCGYASVKALG